MDVPELRAKAKSYEDVKPLTGRMDSKTNRLAVSKHFLSRHWIQQEAWEFYYKWEFSPDITIDEYGKNVQNIEELIRFKKA